MNISTQGRVSLPVALNWHFEPRCNYRCKFCFAHFADIEEKSDYPIPQLYADLYARGVRKITFVGGEPMLDRRIDHRIILAAEMGFTTVVEPAILPINSFLCHLELEKIPMIRAFKPTC